MAEDKGDIIVQQVTVTINQVGHLNVQYTGCPWGDAIKLLELGKLYVFHDVVHQAEEAKVE